MQLPDDTFQLGPHLVGVLSQNLLELVATASAAPEQIAWTRKCILISQLPLVISRLARCVHRLLHMDAEPSRRAACCNAEHYVERLLELEGSLLTDELALVPRWPGAGGACWCLDGWLLC